jgi:hypothetical protein
VALTLPLAGFLRAVGSILDDEHHFTSVLLHAITAESARFYDPTKCPEPTCGKKPQSAPQPMLAASKRASLSRGGVGSRTLWDISSCLPGL